MLASVPGSGRWAFVARAAGYARAVSRFETFGPFQERNGSSVIGFRQSFSCVPNGRFAAFGIVRREDRAR